MAKSLIATYFLWLVGGLYGLHHFYLGRDGHAFVWWMLAGGYFGLGWIRDLWRIPEYVKDANDDEEYLQELTEKMRREEKPASGTVRLCGQMIVADTLGYLALGAIPSDYVSERYFPVCAVIVPLAVAIGVHLVGNIGRHEGSFWVAFVGAYLTYPLYFWTTNSVFFTSLTSSTFFNSYAKQWRRTPRKKKPLYLRLTILFLCGALYLSLWGSWIYFNCTVTDRNENEVKCRDAAKNFFTSPMWQEFKTVITDIYTMAKHHGWKEIWHQIVEAFDPQGEANALKVLNLTSSASQDEITRQYRRLSRQWHPDRFKDNEEKLEAQEHFIEIQKAYETLSNIKAQRMKQNKKERENPLDSSTSY